MAFSVVGTAASSPVPDQIRINYELRDGTTVIDTGFVQGNPPYNPTWTDAQYKTALKNWFIQNVRDRIQAKKAIVTFNLLTYLQGLIAAGTLVVTEAD